jgi:hypothetical protein
LIMEGDLGDIGPRGILLESKEAGPLFALGDLEQVVDRLAEPRREPLGDALEDLVADAGGDRGHDPFEGRGRRQDDLPRSEQILGAVKELGVR